MRANLAFYGDKVTSWAQNDNLWGLIGDIMRHGVRVTSVQQRGILANSDSASLLLFHGLHLLLRSLGCLGWAAVYISDSANT